MADEDDYMSDKFLAATAGETHANPLYELPVRAVCPPPSPAPRRGCRAWQGWKRKVAIEARAAAAARKRGRVLSPREETVRGCRFALGGVADGARGRRWR